MDANITTQVTPQGQAGKAAPKGNAHGLYAQSGAQNFLDLLFGAIGAQNQQAFATKQTAPGTQNGKSPIFNTALNAQGTDTAAAAVLPAQTPLAQTSNTQTQAAGELNLENAAAETAALTSESTEALAENPAGLESILPLPEQDGAAVPETPELNALNLPGETQAGVPELSENSAGNKSVMKDILETMLQGLPEDSGAKIITLPQGKLKDIDLQIDISENESSPALIATDLSPETLTQLANAVDEGVSRVIGLVKILPPQAKRERILMPRAIIVPGASNTNLELAPKPAKTPGENIAQNQSTQSSDDMAASLNALNVGAGSADGAPGDGSESVIRKPGGFGQILEILEDVQNRLSGFDKQASGLEKAMERIAAKQSAGNSTIPAQNQSPAQGQNNTAPISGLFSSAAWDTVFPEGLDWAQGSGSAPALSVSNPAGLASLVSHAPHASQGHPTSQSVAATITRTASSGESKNITIKLDPPDLGRVEIRFEFGKDKTVKANVLIEKPETHLMLQRDAHLLERALQDAGLETDENSLSFELDDGSGFDSQTDEDGTGHGQTQSGNASGSETPEEEIIETTMDLAIDPETGLMRVNIMA
jgi:hypothetical protein